MLKSIPYSKRIPYFIAKFRYKLYCNLTGNSDSSVVNSLKKLHIDRDGDTCYAIKRFGFKKNRIVKLSINMIHKTIYEITTKVIDE